MNHQHSFGSWLRARRKELDLTQRDVAMLVGCAETTIQKIEMDRRRPSRQIALLLAESLLVPQEDRPSFMAFARAAPATTTADVASGIAIDQSQAEEQENEAHVHHLRILPPRPLTRLLGREEELAAIQTLLVQDRVRLLTLVGSPGVGKTRVALEVCERLGSEFVDGVHFVSLAPIRDPAFMFAAIAQALGVRTLGSQPLQIAVATYLRNRNLLLVLDNFEQVVSAGPLVSDLLVACPALQVLVTSREALRLSGERLFVISPLAAPPTITSARAAAGGVNNLLAYPTVELFIERALSSRPELELTEENLSAVGALCAHLEGLPLAIELAAARSKLLSPLALLASLDRRLNTLDRGQRDLPERQQTLRRAIAWSYDLLDRSEQLVFRSLGIFVGGCTLSAAEAVTNPRGVLGADILDIMQSLVDKSLLAVAQEEGTGADEVRFSMLETIREYAWEKLEASGERLEVAEYHAEYYLALAEAAEPGLLGINQAGWLRRLEAEIGNLRVVLAGELEQGKAERVLRLAGAIWRFWWVNQHAGEGRKWLEDTLSIGQAAFVAPGVRAKALGSAGKLAWEQADYSQASTYLSESLSLYRELKDEKMIASALNSAAVPLIDLCEYTKAGAFLDESLELFTQMDDRSGIAVTTANLANIASYNGEWEASAAFHERSLMLRRQLNDRWHIIHSLRDLARVTARVGNSGRAILLYEEAVTLCREIDDRAALALTLKDLSLLSLEQDGDYEEIISVCRDSLAVCRSQSARSGVAEILLDLGRLLFMTGNYAEAGECVDESLTLNTELGTKREIARCLALLAEISAGRG